ncbi:MAG: SprT family protein [Lactobacillaceae bacterium]|jgi:SprT-like protein|nr:SprT family protein [Lactobacillaceae bacterium]
MTNDELQTLVNEISINDFKRPFLHHATFNRRLKTTGGRYLLKTHNLEFNPLMLEEFDLATLIGVIKHELVHYHNHLQGIPYQHRDAAFKSELARINGSRFAPKTSKAQSQTKLPTEFKKYVCRNGHEILRKRAINVNRYVCGICKARLQFAGYVKVQP